MPTWCAGSATPTDGWIAPGPRTGISPSWPPASPGCSGTGPGSPPPGDEDDKSPVTGDRHAGICGSRGLQCPRLPDPASQVGREPFDVGRVVARVEVRVDRVGRTDVGVAHTPRHLVDL